MYIFIICKQLRINFYKRFVVQVLQCFLPPPPPPQDFALDPDIHCMHLVAHHMVRHLTAGVALITCREPLLLSISTNLKATFTNM